MPKLVRLHANEYNRELSQGVWEDSASFGAGMMTHDPRVSPQTGDILAFRFHADRGKYELRIEYAASKECSRVDSRPCVLIINDQQITDIALSGLTGGWNSASTLWVSLGVIDLLDGENILKFEATKGEHGKVLPHIKEIEMRPRK